MSSAGGVMSEEMRIFVSEVGSASEVVFDDTSDEAEAVTLIVAAEQVGERLDKWLAAQLAERSRSEVQRWIEAGLVTRAGRPLKANYRVRPGEEITFEAPPAEAYDIAPEPIPLVVLYEDDDLLVIDKPAGMVVHPAAGNWRGTLVNAVLYHCPDLEGVGGVRRPGIVHRLDKDTSGVIIIAKQDAALRSLQAQFKARQVRKTYVALVFGQMVPPQGEINAAIGRDVRDRKRMAVVPASQGRLAVTRYETLDISKSPTTGERLSLLTCQPLTGRTHQIRVHLAHARHPIVGDEVYGGRRQAPIPCPRQFLHAQQIRFRLPATGEMVEFSAALPAELGAVLRVLGMTPPALQQLDKRLEA